MDKKVSSALVNQAHPEALMLEALERARVPGACAAFAVVLRRDENGQEYLWSDGCALEYRDLLYELRRQLVRLEYEQFIDPGDGI